MSFEDGRKNSGVRIPEEFQTDVPYNQGWIIGKTDQIDDPVAKAVELDGLMEKAFAILHDDYVREALQLGFPGLPGKKYVEAWDDFTRTRPQKN